MKLLRCLKLAIFLFFISFAGQSFAQTSQIDSLKAVLPNMKEDTSKVNTLIEIARQSYRISPEECMKYSSEAKFLAEILSFSKGLAFAYKYIGMGHYFQGEYWEAVISWEMSLSIFESIDDNVGVSNMDNNLGAVYNNIGDDKRALNYYLRSLQAAEEITDTSRIAIASMNIGAIYLKKKETHDMALENYLSVLPLIETLGDQLALGTVSSNLGGIYYEKEEHDSALYYYEKSLAAYEKSHPENIPYAMTNIGRVYMNQGLFEMAIEFQKDAYGIARESDAKLEMTATLLGLAETYSQQGDILSAIARYKEAEEIANVIGAKNELRDAYQGLSGNYAKQSYFSKAYHYQTLLTEINDTLFLAANDRLVDAENFFYEVLVRKNKSEIEVLEQQSILEQFKSRRQKTIIIAIGSFGLLILIFAVRFYNQTRYVKKINAKIRDQKDEIEAQRDEIEAQRDEVELQRDVVIGQKNEIVDSINYAKRIQSAMLPSETYLTELLNESFIFYKPRDIVSGDYYWIKQVNQYIVLVAADCTGHGIPGALMSMLGISYLNEIVQRREITQSNQILNELRKQIKFSLRQHGKPDEAKDGIDLALCVMDLRNMQMQYSGANNPLYFIRDVEDVPELKEIKADRMPIGYYHGKDKTFTSHDIQLEMGDTFYIFSDGFIDQKGGKDNKKFMSKNFKKLLLKIHDQPMYEQKEILDKTLSDWKGNNYQMDDILVIGVRV